MPVTYRTVRYKGSLNHYLAGLTLKEALSTMADLYAAHPNYKIGEDRNMLYFYVNLKKSKTAIVVPTSISQQETVSV